ncbi:MAG: ABC transporter permease [Gammaproteobacteria bacterium]|nr:MAG: ABC transporter permease [Gammaproteobacteria bacterium]
MQTIPIINLSIAAIPVVITIIILYKWSHDYKNGIYAVCRMLGQLLIIGYFLAFIFESDSALIVLGVASFMLFVSAWISLRTVPDKRRQIYLQALGSLLIGGGSALALISLGVLQLDPWYNPRFFVPLAGMVFANSMNCISLAADRLSGELQRGGSYEFARNHAFRAALIPSTNQLFAVGLVAIPGMMTGQILSGVSPLIAARYQIMIMCMIYGTSGITTACFLSFARPYFVKDGTEYKQGMIDEKTDY